MIPMRQIPFEDLPPKAAQGFLYAYSLESDTRFVIRVVNTDGAPRELEFDAREQRFLSAAERARALPPAGSVVYAPGSWEVRAAYTLNERGELRVHSDVYDRHQGARLTELDKAVYAALEWNVPDTVARAVAQAHFPKEYASWDEQSKIGYWALALYRVRRSVQGDSDEDDVFTPELLREMQAIDPAVVSRLRTILHLAAKLGGEEPEALTRSFEQRVGISLD
ncbi:MAG: hypothetical protein RL701_2299 [Pseudomonadota bacterium]